MILRPFTLLSLVAFLGAGLHVYQTKHEAALLDSELRSIARQVREAEARSQTLQAEWAWLNEPQRLRAVAQRHLPELEAMQPAQFIRASEAERRLPAVTAYAGPVALFAARETPPPQTGSALALLPRAADAVQVAVAPVAMPPAPLPAPVVVAETIPVAEPEPVITMALPAALPPVVAAVRPEPAPAAASQPRPALRATTSVASLPPVAAPPPRRMVTQVATTVQPRPVAAPPQVVANRAPAAQGFSARDFGAQSFTMGSALGNGQPMLAPPVPFGSAGAATLGGRAPTQ